MKEIILVPKEQPAVSLEAEVISPDIFAGKSIKEIEELEVFYGNAKGKLGEFFDISGARVDEAKDIRVIIDGDVYRTKRIGQGMRNGELHVKGNADMYLGMRMRGGRIIVDGDVDAFSALQMRGGELVVKGNAGDYLGSAYRGDWRGMRGGKILVEGDVGGECGGFMRGGRIHIKGNSGSFLGVHMAKGLIIVDGETSERTGAQMKGGTIIAARVGKLLPGFRSIGEVEDIEVDGEVFKGRYSKYSGDHTEPATKGTLYVKL